MTQTTQESVAAQLRALDDETMCFDGPATYALIGRAADMLDDADERDRAQAAEIASWRSAAEVGDLGAEVTPSYLRRRLAQHMLCADNAKAEVARLTAENERLTSESGADKATFDLRWAADQRAIKRWQATTGRVNVWPDRADMVVLLLEVADRAEAALAASDERVKAMLKDLTVLRASLHREQDAVEVFLHAYRKRYARPSTGGVRENAPMRSEVVALIAALTPAAAPARGQDVGNG